MTAPRPDDAQRRRNVRLAVGLGMVAIAVYVIFFLVKGLGGS